jgi:Domain of unknown function (DUF4836)
MQLRFCLRLLAAILILALASCTKTNKQGKYIPKDAAIVLHVDGASLTSKLPWDEVKKNALFQHLYAGSSVPAFIKQALDNPDNSGIDTKNDLVFFSQKDSSGGLVAFTGTIKDAEKFKLFALDVTKGGAESEKDGVNYISKAPVCVGWNKEKFLYLINTPELNTENYSRQYSDSNYTPKSRDLGAACKNLFNLKESNSLGENEKFTALVKKTGDLHFWMNAEELNKAGLVNPALAMLNMTKLYEGSITAATINFENGKILIDAKSYAGKELTDLYKKYGGKNIDEDMIKRLPLKDVAAVFAMSFKPEGIKELLKLIGVEGYANMGLAFAGFSLDDFIKANKGDILISVGDFKKQYDTAATDTHTQLLKVKPDVLFATSIGDKEAFNLLIKAAEKFGKSVPADFPVTYNSNGKYFAISSSKENTDKYIANNSNNNFDFLSKISGNPFGGYINLQYILKAFESDATKDSTAKIIYDASLKIWDNVYMKGGNYEDGALTQTVEINLMDKNTNSLKQLNQYLGYVGQIVEEKKKQMELLDLSSDVQTVYPPLSALGDSANSKK